MRSDFFSSTGFSLYLALVATMLSTVFGVLIAYAFVTSKNRMIKGVVRKSLQTGLIIPYIYVVFLAILLFSQTGFILRVLFNLGLITYLKNFQR